MKLQMTGKNVELSSTVRRYLERKLSKINRHLPNIIESKVEISEQKTKSPQQRFVVQATVDSNGTVLRGEERGEDLLSAIDKVVAIMERQVEHHKGKLHAKGRGSSFVRAESNQSIEEAESLKRVVRVKRFVVKPMLVDEAIDQMELLGHNFFLFFNAENRELNLLYRRKEGNYGLIEPKMG